MSMMGGTKEAVEALKRKIEKEGARVNIDNINYEALESAVQDEYNCGADGSIYDVLTDLMDSVGLEEFGFIIEG